MRIKKIIESRFAGFFCFAFAITNRIIFTTLYSTIGRDTMVQLTYTENLMAGKGLGATKYFIADPGHPVFDAHQLFPPGYSFSIIPFLKIFPNDPYKAVFVHDIISALLFILAIRFAGKKIGLGKIYLNILTLIAGCSQYIFFTSGSATDAIGLSFLLFAFGVTIYITGQPKPLSLFKVIGFGIILFLPSFYRFMYIPITILLPVSIFLAGLFSKNKVLRDAGWKMGFVVLLLLGIQLGYPLYHGAEAVHIATARRGVFPEQVNRWYPFIPASFINLDFAAQQGSKITGADYSTMMRAFEVINMTLIFMLSGLLVYFIFKQKKRPVLLPGYYFIIIGAAISITIILILIYPTLTYKIDEEPGHYTWTFIYDARYYAFLYCFIPLLFFFIPSVNNDFFKNKIGRWIWLVGFLLFMIEVSHGIYYNIKILANHKDIDVVRNRDADFRGFTSVISDLKKKYPGREILISGTDQSYLHKASLMGHKALFDYQNLNSTIPSVIDSTVLLVSVYSQDHQFVKEYLEKNKPELFRTIGGTSFYVQELNPQGK